MAFFQGFSLTFSQTQPSNPASTTSTTAVMMGLDRTIVIGNSGILDVIISGTCTNSADNDGLAMQLRYANQAVTAAPTNGAALVGTQLGSAPEFVNSGLTASGLNVPITVNGIVSGLTPGATYWVDVALNSITGGTSAIGFLSCTLKTY